MIKSIVFCLMSVAFSITAADVSKFSVHSMLDMHGISSSDTKSWIDADLGKTRYSNRNPTIKVAEASLISIAKLKIDTNFITHLQYAPKQRHKIDIIESFINYKPLIDDKNKLQLKIGAFFPPISLEHHGFAWTSPYTINTSAINTWIGEEIRTIGIEGNYTKKWNDDQLKFTAAVYKFNDPAGTILAWRGWSMHNRKSGIFERLALPPLPSIGPGNKFARQAQWIDPFMEIDNRYGYYTGMQFKNSDILQLEGLFYHNKANPEKERRLQYAWRTYFLNLGIKYALTDEIEILSQYMDGNTIMGFKSIQGYPLDNDFSSYYLMISKLFDQHRISARFDYFAVKDKDYVPNDNNSEHGLGFTVAYGLPIFDKPNSMLHQHLMLEFMHLKYKRANRIDIGYSSTKNNETLVTLSYKLFFMNLV